MIPAPLFFTFTPRWKEELVVSAAPGSFVLCFWMGTPTVELPEKDLWPDRAPDWARDHWDSLHRALSLWCAGNGAALEITSGAWVSRA